MGVTVVLAGRSTGSLTSAMPRSRFSREPKWKQALAVACLAYATAVWILPIALVPFVNILPFVQPRSEWERLPFSTVGTVLVVLAVFALNDWRLPAGRAPRGGSRAKGSRWVGVIAGFALSAYAGAAFSANLLGLAGKLLPGEKYSARVTIDSARHSGSSLRFRAVTLQYRDPASGESRHLVLSRRLFDYPAFQAGDVIQLRGYRTMIGVYVNEFDLLEKAPTGRPT